MYLEADGARDRKARCIFSFATMSAISSRAISMASMRAAWDSSGVEDRGNRGRRPKTRRDGTRPSQSMVSFMVLFVSISAMYGSMVVTSVLIFEYICRRGAS